MLTFCSRNYFSYFVYTYILHIIKILLLLFVCCSFIPSTPVTKRDRRRSKNRCLRFLRRRWVIFGLLANVILAYILVVVLVAVLGSRGHNGKPRTITVRKGAVVSDHEVCSRIGRYELF